MLSSFVNLTGDQSLVSSSSPYQKSSRLPPTTSDSQDEAVVKVKDEKSTKRRHSSTVQPRTRRKSLTDEEYDEERGAVTKRITEITDGRYYNVDMTPFLPGVSQFHIDELKPFQCKAEDCGKKYKNLVGIISHHHTVHAGLPEASEEDPKPYKCEIGDCDLEYKHLDSPTTLKEDMQSSHHTLLVVGIQERGKNDVKCLLKLRKRRTRSLTPAMRRIV
ncbi:hypothetical protein M427DRAFT_300622 [Gonapodya prolifera JEL478]|uniref:C2H2-type domain-containing protein n=1 Tax=Gonapodya prolifera (strain JEL478) TaxID=1344416 RepID=A0A139AI49_GONPJ|nr:hypothetical protein M427DRAFT_300622 [Gonapodya prolifera JEL478]|eukprot:KXS16093.1 hypothetical protein M427DRAFT_300622 [Gonapodya prolifera JEL478]